MAIDKGLYAAPIGLEQMAAEPDIEIEIENPDEVDIDIDGVEIQLRPEPKTGDDFDANLAEYIDESELQSLALVEDFEKDMRDRKEWIQTYIEGLKLWA
jgi:hypothetical protein